VQRIIALWLNLVVLLTVPVLGAAENLAELRAKAESGDANAQNNLGVIYAKGDGVAKDPTEAAKWYRKAAEQGDGRAQYWLGIMYLAGAGVAEDQNEGIKWFRKAAEQGYAPAQLDLGLYYLVGLGVPKDPTEAFSWYRKAAKQGNADAQSRLAGLYAAGWGALMDEIEALAWYNVSAISGDSNVSKERNDLARRVGQNVATIGFPNINLQGFSPKLTRGEISSLNGFGDDPRGWQISAPVQPGNSGGPLLDENGNLIGVVVAKLGLSAAKATGDLPQNVNYAVKSAYALALLEPYLDASAPEPIQPDKKPIFEDMVAKAQQSVVLILVY
jgi:hypothetical protein